MRKYSPEQDISFVLRVSALGVLTGLQLRCTFIAASESALRKKKAQEGEFFDKMMIRIESFAARDTPTLLVVIFEL